MTRRSLLTLALGSGALFGCATVPPRAGLPPRRLIEFGWDEPDTAFLRQHIAEMERQPFDGCVFHVTYVRPEGKPGHFMWDAWGRRRFSDAELEPALADLQATESRRFSHNFLRFNVTPGNVDWFDEFAPIVANAGLAARLAREGGAAGILLDVEQYQAPLFNYRKQRHAFTRRWDDYARQVRQRGGEVMTAFQEGYPHLTVFLTFGYSLPWWDLRAGARSLAECDYGLLAPFLDGMVDAASERTRLVDGYELAYYHRKDTSRFAAGYRTVREALLPIVADPAKYRRILSVAFGLWLDVDSRRIGWDGVDGERNYYSPAAFEHSVRGALEVADEYVWIYTEIPRWWSAEGSPVNLPAGYADALWRARRGLTP